MTVIDHTGKEVGERAVWAPRYGTKEPVWNCAHDMKLPKMPYQDLKRSLLHVELWDHDGLLPPNPIAQIDVPLLTLLSDTHIPVPLAPSPLCDDSPAAYDVTSSVDSAGGEISVPASILPDGASSSPPSIDPSVPNPLMRLVKKSWYALGGTLRLDPWDLTAESVGNYIMGRGGDRADGAEGESDTAGAPAAGALAAAPCCVLLRLLSGYPRRKRLYIVRHGESVWNKAQASLDVPSMYAQVDHPLSIEGRKQAEELAMRLSVALKGATSSGSGAAVTAAEEETGGGGAASATESTAGVANVESASAAAAEGAPATVSDEAEAAALCELCAADLIMCSPLTRALQTCVLALGGVLKERAQPIYLAPNARERINPGSADSFGCAIGATEVHERLLAKTADLVHGENDIVTPSGAAKAILDGLSFDDIEVRGRWWSAGPEAATGAAGVQQRLGDLLDQIKYSPAETVVLVGHSHFFRELLRAQLDPSFAEREPTLAAQLKSRKLSNCGVARLELDFEAAPSTPIVDVRLVAGTTLVK